MADRMEPDKYHALSRLRQAIIDNTKGDLFWIGEILLVELQKETGFTGKERDAYCQYCGCTEIRYVGETGNPYCGNQRCAHMMTWGIMPEGFKPAHPTLLNPSR